MIQALARHAERKPDVPAFIDAASGEQIRWRVLLNRVNALAGELRSKAAENSVVLIRLPNSCEFPTAFLGTLASGCTAFPISPDTPASQLESLAQQTGARVLIEPGELKMLSTMPRTDVPAGLLLLSSGSTGQPKIVCRSLESLSIVSDQMCQSIGIDGNDRVLATVPICHSYGLEHGLLAPVWAGATVHLSRGLDLSLIQRELKESRITVLPAVPSIFEMLANLSPHGERYPGLRSAYSAGAPLPTSVADRFFDRCGIRIGQLFGATEIGSVTYSNPSDPHFDPASVGQPMPGVRIKIEDEHLWIAAGSMFSGYLDEFAQIEDGFYSTGDLARLDEHGNLIITGRAKLLIDIGGLKVNPLEVEQVLMQHPAVAGVAAVGVPDPRWGHQVGAAIQLRDGVSATREEFEAFARERLAHFKVPRHWLFVDAFPMTASGKVRKVELEDKFPREGG